MSLLPASKSTESSFFCFLVLLKIVSSSLTLIQDASRCFQGESVSFGDYAEGRLCALGLGAGLVLLSELTQCGEFRTHRQRRSPGSDPSGTP